MNCCLDIMEHNFSMKNIGNRDEEVSRVSELGEPWYIVFKIFSYLLPLHENVCNAHS